MKPVCCAWKVAIETFVNMRRRNCAVGRLTAEVAIRFATDLLMSPEQCVHIGWNAELVSCLLEYIERLRDIHIDIVEFCVLNAIVLTYPGVCHLPHLCS